MRAEAAGAGRVPAILPLRATTFGESLDGAIVLLRRRALPLLLVAAVLAAGEQVLLTSLRADAGLMPPFYLPGADAGDWWRTVVTGLAAEVGIIALLGAYAGAATGPALLGRAAGGWRLWLRTRPWWSVPVALLLAALAWPAGWAGLFGLVVLYGLFGLATPLLTLDRVSGPLTALGRSARLSTRGGLRVTRIRIVGYLTWLGIRFALGTGWIAVASLVTDVTDVSGADWLHWALPIAWGLANTVAYAALACLDAVLLVEARIRTEGLDIVLGRARARGEDDAAALVAGR
ncbi:hypothetical protein [Actinoplanes awajinensis]|uniref:Glycerophosphoryl diester phosphodiesterase membrane domain-containing protein n=1 Tax=Actinoplanes awajinensis subsp. mycoplanecinus TaxID=135947 RepID=A0A117MQZ0_9ACTN|nr:hypothetical protein [Actinoplanes awajinensis]KUL30970.1 hypothetical protein ADL15_23775 [Actinoplanes awajinensis subsp. mycoplanecinus]